MMEDNINAEEYKKIKEDWLVKFSGIFQENEITRDYRQIYRLAQELASNDIEDFPLRKKETVRDRFEKHLLGMIEMYSIRYGDYDTRVSIVQYIEKQMFNQNANDDDIPHITYDAWQKIKDSVIKGEYSTE